MENSYDQLHVFTGSYSVEFEGDRSWKGNDIFEIDKDRDICG